MGREIDVSRAGIRRLIEETQGTKIYGSRVFLGQDFDPGIGNLIAGLPIAPGTATVLRTSLGDVFVIEASPLDGTDIMY